MKIHSIKIDNLYGSYSYDIQNISDLLVLTGFNGTGKTTILNIIRSIAETNLYFFYELEFDAIEIKFDDDLMLSVVSKDKVKEDVSESSDSDSKPEREISFCWTQKDNEICSLRIDKQELHSAYIAVTNSEYLLNSEWTADIQNRMDDVVQYIIQKQKAGSFSMITSTLKTFFVPAQRIKTINRVESDYPFDDSMEEVYTIDTIVERFKEVLQKNQIDFLKKIQNSRDKLIDRLLEENTKVLDEAEYDKLKVEVQNTIGELREFGLNYEEVKNYDKKNAKILSVYLTVVKDNLSVYSDLLNELKLFSSILKEKRFAHKRILFSPDYGFKVFSDKGVSIKPARLSSGEQNTIILLYRIIFDVKRGDVLLIDEPEISMHVVWLKEFIMNLQDIIKAKGCQVIIATHSPQIVRGAYDYCYDLELGYGK